MIVALALPSVATARLRTIAPPGDSAVSQYVESVPTDGGQRPTSSLGSQPGALSPSQRATLDHAGANGKTLAAVVNATSPATGSGHSGSGAAAAGNGAGSGFLPGAISGRGARSPVSSVLAAATGGGGGMGILLPVLLTAVALSVLCVVLLRRRRIPPPS